MGNKTLKKGNFIIFTYKNWKGKVSQRKAIFSEISYGSNAYHKEPQFILIGYDVDKCAFRTFAMKDITDLTIVNI